MDPLDALTQADRNDKAETPAPDAAAWLANPTEARPEATAEDELHLAFGGWPRSR